MQLIVEVIRRTTKRFKKQVFCICFFFGVSFLENFRFRSNRCRIRGLNRLISAKEPRPNHGVSHMKPVAFAVFFYCVCLFGSQSLFADEPTKGEKLFALKINRLFAEKCIACHGDKPDNIEGGFDMRTRESLQRGGDAFGEDVLKPGSGVDSYLHIVTTRSEDGFEMPPKESEKLSLSQMNWIRDWINEGAPWPTDKRVAEIQSEYAEGETVKTSGGLGDDWTNRRYQSKHLWAYRPLKVVQVPKAAHPVDWFLDKRLNELEVQAAPLAGFDELVRRLSFNLTGLPPNVLLRNPAKKKTYRELYAKNEAAFVESFANDLMSSPHYGEHFGRHWLDVARYADSAGFANDYPRPNVWRYRDYVIRSFNADKPFDEFVRQQIAGDEMDDSKSENLIATGFLRMGPWEQTAMSVFRVTRQQWLDDVTDSVGQTFLAHPLQCCKCHDHKFDPLPTRDYYSMMAVFSATQFSERNAPFLKSENKTGFKPSFEWTMAKIQAYQKQRDDLKTRVAKQKKQETGDAKVGDNGLDPGDEASLARINKNISLHQWELDRVKPIAFGVYSGKTVTRVAVSKRLFVPKDPWAKGVIEKDVILSGGDAFSFGAPVTPGPISAAVYLGGMDPPVFPTGQGKRRLALADWIVDKKNPLTARVMVNRIWSWHFGKGIAGNPNNFGATGALPTHPELLDYLADWFMKNGWSIKKLNRLLVTSRAYRRSSRHDQMSAVQAKDPKLGFYATFLPRRLTAEEIRDAMLASSGELNRQIGGIPCRPEINSEVATQPRQIMGGTASVYEPDSHPQLRNRRSIYAEKRRGLRDPFFETFNQPGPDKSCERREISTVTPQALTLMNSGNVQSRGLAFAKKLMSEKRSEAGTLSRAFQIAMGRDASNDELKICLEHWKMAATKEANKSYVPKKYETKMKRTVMAEKTGEPYDFLEFMPTFEKYIPDLQPHQVAASTRGLAQICVALFNSNEFVYLD